MILVPRFSAQISVYALGLMVCLSALAAEPVTDLRVLIDISGSMKDNDPKYLRKPALRLLTGLLPNNSQAGVWLFGAKTKSLVPHGQVNERWKQLAKKAADKIHSRGLFTNIEEALNKASADWNEPDANANRHLILLTDGVVDVSKKQAESDASRQRIISEVIPRLKRAGVRTHTIALSANADHALLKQIALETDGANEQVDTPDRLHRIFLHLFEKAARQDTLPIVGNQFEVDSSIKDLTLLVFRQSTTSDTQLISPSGNSFGKGDKPANVQWHSEAAYDLITVKKPAEGIWKIQADVDPDNRALVVTDLKMTVSDLPAHVIVGDAVQLDVKLMQDGKHIKKRAFLDFIQIDGEQLLGDEKTDLNVNDRAKYGDQQRGDGIFGSQLSLPKSGRYEISVIADGTTFKRQNRQTVSVHNPVTREFYQDDDGYQIEVKGNPQLMDVNKFYVKGIVNLPDGKQLVLQFETLDEHVRVSTLGHLDEPGTYVVQLQSKIMDRHKKIHTLTLAPLDIVIDPPEGYVAEPVPEKAVEKKPPVEAGPIEIEEDLPEVGAEEAEDEEEEALDEEEELDEEAAEPAEEEGMPMWLIATLMIVGLNGLLAGIGFVVYRKMQNKGSEDAEEETGSSGGVLDDLDMDDLEEDEDEDDDDMEMDEDEDEDDEVELEDDDEEEEEDTDLGELEDDDGDDTDLSDLDGLTDALDGLDDDDDLDGLDDDLDDLADELSGLDDDDEDDDDDDDL